MAPARIAAGRLLSRWPDLGQGNPFFDVLEDDLHGHADCDILWRTLDDVGGEHGAFLQLDQGVHIGRVVPEGGVEGDVVDVEREDGPSSAGLRQLNVGRKGLIGVVPAKGKGPVPGPAGGAAVQLELAAPDGFPEILVVLIDVGLGPFRCDGDYLLSIRVECMELMPGDTTSPPCPVTMLKATLGSCRSPASPRSWVTASDRPVMSA